MSFYTDKNGNVSVPKALASAATGIALVIGATTTFTTVEETEVGADYQFGELVTKDASELRKPGLSLKAPWTSVKKMRTDLQQADYPEVHTYTKDNQPITVTLSVMFRTPADKIVDILRKNPDYEVKLKTTVLDSAKSALGITKAPAVAKNREAIMHDVTAKTQEEVNALLGIDVVTVKLPNFDFEDAFEKAIQLASNEKAALEQQRTQLEQTRVTAEKNVVAAQATADATRLQADATAYRTTTEAEAQAKANLTLAKSQADGFNQIVKAIGNNHMDTYLQTEMMRKTWQGQLPQVSGGSGGNVTTVVPLPSLGK